MTEFERGYQQALSEISQPMHVKSERWTVSRCPRCNYSFYDYELCDDGYYTRATNLCRCPKCGQALDWSQVVD